MPLNEAEKEEIRGNRFHLDLLEMTLVRRGDPSDAYRGPGFVRQAAGGKLEFRIYDRSRQTSFASRMMSLSAGVIIPDEEFYDLEGRDLRGRIWRASQILPNDEGTFGVDGCVCEGTIREITCAEEAGPSAGDGLWMYLPGDFKPPTNAGTSHVAEALERKSLRLDLNLWKIESGRYELLLTKAEDGLEVAVSVSGEELPAHFDLRLEEALWFTLAFPAKWSILQRRRGGEHQCTIRALRDQPVRPRMQPPLNPGHGVQATHVGDMLLKYLEYVLPFAEADHYHPTSVAIIRSLRASAVSLDSEAWWLSAAVEGLARHSFPGLGRPGEKFLKDLDAAIDFIEKWDGEPDLKKRIVKSLDGWRGANPREVLKQLVEKGVITEQQREAWNRLRHRMAHGHELGELIDELNGLCDLIHMALLRMLFEAIGYSGPYTDRSTPGWPQAEYVVKLRE
jgi:hypothetical protein